MIARVAALTFTLRVDDRTTPLDATLEFHFRSGVWDLVAGDLFQRLREALEPAAWSPAPLPARSPASSVSNVQSFTPHS